MGLLLRDVTDLTRALDELTALAFHDPLTGLVNLEGCRRELEPRLAQAGARSWLVLWLDLDGFRRVNHSYGRESGDWLLQAGVRRRCRSLQLLRWLMGFQTWLLLLRASKPRWRKPLH